MKTLIFKTSHFIFFFSAKDWEYFELTGRWFKIQIQIGRFEMFASIKNKSEKNESLCGNWLWSSVYGRAYASLTHFDHDHQHFRSVRTFHKVFDVRLTKFRPIARQINSIVPSDLQPIPSWTFHLNTFKFHPKKVVRINLKDILKSISIFE